MDDLTLTTTICELLGGIEGWAWRPTGPAYDTDEVGVYYGAIKSAPDRAVGVRVYGGRDEVATGLAIRRVQLMMRGPRNDPAGADALAAAAFALLQDLSRTGGINGIRRTSLAPLGADGNGREERSDNYQITLDQPGG